MFQSELFASQFLLQTVELRFSAKKLRKTYKYYKTAKMHNYVFQQKTMKNVELRFSAKD